MDFGPRDKYGVPSRFFGMVPEEFYALVGRVVMVAAVLEDRLITLLTILSPPPRYQSTFAGMSAGQINQRIDKELSRRPAPFTTEGQALLARAGQAFDRRNEIVHSLWPNPTLEHAWGHRTVTAGKRIEGKHSAAVTTSEDELTRLVNELVDLYGAVRDFELSVDDPQNVPGQ